MNIHETITKLYVGQLLKYDHNSSTAITNIMKVYFHITDYENTGICNFLFDWSDLIQFFSSYHNQHLKLFEKILLKISKTKFEKRIEFKIKSDLTIIISTILINLQILTNQKERIMLDNIFKSCNLDFNNYKSILDNYPEVIRKLEELETINLFFSFKHDQNYIIEKKIKDNITVLFHFPVQLKYFPEACVIVIHGEKNNNNMVQQDE